MLVQLVKMEGMVQMALIRAAAVVELARLRAAMAETVAMALMEQVAVAEVGAVHSMASFLAQVVAAATAE